MPHTPEQRREYLKRPEVKARNNAKRNGPQNRFYSLKSRTGWTKASREAALITQDGVCAICPRAMGDEVNCDHSHESKKPRALLCRACNLGLGYYEKWQRPAGLAIEPYERYLARW